MTEVGRGAPADPVLALDGITKEFAVDGWRGTARVRAVNGISLELRAGETVGVVGESGCGKTTVAKVVLGAERPTHGAVRWHGADIGALGRSELRRYRAAVQAVFQDPTSSLNPRMRIGDAIAEPLRIHRRGGRDEIRARVDTLLGAVGLEAGLRSSYPHELSGGMRQRVAIARALALEPEALVLDEPVSSLDVSVRAQIMNLLRRLRDEHGFACILIAHDLASVRYMADRVMVMYLGRAVELGTVETVFTEARHPYTRALLDAVLSVDEVDEVDEGGGDDEGGGGEGPPEGPPTALSGEIPSPLHLPSGCPLHTRCPLAFDRCATDVPQLTEVAPGHFVECHLHDQHYAGGNGAVDVPVAVRD
jgi:ABC-type glutathione transport system ATPase component